MRSAIIIFLLCRIFLVDAQYQNFVKADSFALSMPDFFWTDEELAQSIVQTGLPATEQLRVLFTWMAKNIIFDIEEFELDVVTKTETSTILEEGMATSQGYAALFHAVCQQLGIKSYVVKGYDKNNFNPKSGNHFWNAVFVNNRWQFIDVANGSGRLTKIGKNNFIKRILKKPTFKNISVFEQKKNDNYFLVMPNTYNSAYLPTDPLWQFTNSPLSLTCFLKNEPNCSGQKGFFSFSDTLTGFLAATPEKQQIASAKRTIQFNRLNCYDPATVYISIGMKYYEELETIVPESTEYLKTTAKKAYSYLNPGVLYMERARHIGDSIYRARAFDFKSDYKSSARNFKTYSKTIDRTVGRSQKHLDKLTKNKSKIKGKLKSYQEKYLNTVMEEKIYLIERSDEMPEREDSVLIVNSKKIIDSIAGIIIKEKDTLEVYFSKEFLNTFDSVRSIRNIIPEILLTTDDILHTLKQIYTENLPCAFTLTDTIFINANHLYNTLVSYEAMIEYMTQYTLRNHHNLVKSKLKIIERNVKAIKRELIAIKKHSVVSQNEEGINDNLNELLSNLYLKYINLFNGELEFYKEEKEFVKSEKKLLKQNKKQIDKTENMLSLFYRYNIGKKKEIYAREKADIKNTNKTASKARNACLRILEK